MKRSTARRIHFGAMSDVPCDCMEKCKSVVCDNRFFCCYVNICECDVSIYLLLLGECNVCLLAFGMAVYLCIYMCVCVLFIRIASFFLNRLCMVCVTSKNKGNVIVVFISYRFVCV